MAEYAERFLGPFGCLTAEYRGGNRRVSQRSTEFG